MRRLWEALSPGWAVSLLFQRLQGRGKPQKEPGTHEEKAAGSWVGLLRFARVFRNIHALRANLARGWKGGNHIEINQGYEILKFVTFDNGRGFALGYDEAAPTPLSHVSLPKRKTASGTTIRAITTATVRQRERTLPSALMITRSCFRCRSAQVAGSLWSITATIPPSGLLTSAPSRSRSATLPWRSSTLTSDVWWRGARCGHYQRRGLYAGNGPERLYSPCRPCPC